MEQVGIADGLENEGSVVIYVSRPKEILKVAHLPQFFFYLHWKRVGKCWEIEVIVIY